MKKIILSTIITAMFVPSMAMANNAPTPPPSEAASDMVTGMEAPVPLELHEERRMHEDGKKGHKGKKGKKGKKEGKPLNFEEMTLEEKEVFFEKRIKGMEKHHARMGEELVKLKAMTTEEKEAFFKSKKGNKKGKHKGQKGKLAHMKKVCAEIESGKEMTPAEALTRMKNSPKWDKMPEEKKMKMEKKIKDFENLSPEQKEKILAEKKEKMQAMCDKIK